MSSVPTARDRFRTFVSDDIVSLAARFGYAVGAVRFTDAVELTLEHGEGRFVVWLRPIDDASRYYRKTARFGIGYSGEPPNRSALALLDALAQCIASWESSLGDDACQMLAPPRSTALESADRRELLAVRTGLKPACRSLLRRDRAEDLAEEARREGLHVRMTDAAAFAASCCGEGVAEQATTLVHVGLTEASAATAAATEQSMIAACDRRERVSDAQIRGLGIALGYPACCIEAFLPIRDRSTADIRFDALARTPAGQVPALLNNVDEGRALVSHMPCRYDCSASLRYARALLTELARIEVEAAESLERELAGLVIMFRREGALRLAPSGALVASTFRYDRIAVAGTGSRSREWRDVLSRGDALEIHPTHARVLRNGLEMHRLEIPPDDVQVRLFA